jgi:hypothetical protein
MTTEWTAETMPIRAVSRTIIGAVLEAHPLPKRPEFDGAPLTLARLEDPKAWPNKGRLKKARAVWDRFMAEANEAERERTDALFTVLMVRGVALDVPPVEDWAPDLVDGGVTPDRVTPATIKLLYIDHLLPEPLDKVRVLERVMEAGGLDAGPLDAVRGLFREALGAVKRA